jgi:hypothetical protein
MGFSIINLIGQFLVMGLIELKDFIYIYIIQTVFLFLYFLCLFYIKLTNCDCIKVKDKLKEFLTFVKKFQQILIIAISVFTAVEIFYPLILLLIKHLKKE